MQRPAHRLTPRLEIGSVEQDGHWPL